MAKIGKGNKRVDLQINTHLYEAVSVTAKSQGVSQNAFICGLIERSFCADNSQKFYRSDTLTATVFNENMQMIHEDFMEFLKAVSALDDGDADKETQKFLKEKASKILKNLVRLRKEFDSISKS